MLVERETAAPKAIADLPKFMINDQCFGWTKVEAGNEVLNPIVRFLRTCDQALTAPIIPRVIRNVEEC
jgi:hypothetical protein